MSRKQSRELAFRLLYQLIYNKSCPITGDVLELAEGESLQGPEAEFVAKLLSFAENNLEEIDSHIESLSKGFKMDRIFSVDLTALRLGIAEIKYMETPASVVADACVEIVKRYSGEKSYSFVNGILAAFIKEGAPE